MTVGTRIKERRLQLGLTADALADILGKNRSTVYRYENGEIENMPIDVLMPIAEALHTTPAYLMGWDQEAIQAADEMIEEAQDASDVLEAQNGDLYTELFELMLTREELLEVIKYANYVKSRR